MRTMPRWLLLSFLVLTVTALLGACGPAGGAATPQPAATARPTATAQPTATEKPAAAELVPYQDTAGRFTISYPSGWRVREEGEQVGFYSPDSLLLILVQTTDLGIELDEQGLRTLIESYFSADGFGGQPGFVREGDEAQADGSVRVDYTFTSDGRPARGSSFFQSQGTVGYILSFYALDETLWQDALPTFGDVAISFAVNPSPDATPLPGTLLTSSAGGYELRVPTDWQSAEQDGNAFVQKDQETFLSIMMTTTLPSADPAQAERILIDEKIAALRADDPNAQITDPDSVPIGGQNGLYVDFVYTDPATNLENMGSIFTVVYRQRAYIFLLFTLRSDAEVNNPLFIDMIKSFRFTK